MYTLNETEFKKLFEEYLPVVIFQSLKLMGSPDIAQDVAADTFIKVWQKRSEFTSRHHAKNFLSIASRNACLNLLNKKGTTDLEVDLPEEREAQISSLTTCDIMKEFNELPGKSKKVFELRVFGGLAFREIGEKLGMKTHTVYIRYLYAVKLITQSVKPVFE